MTIDCFSRSFFFLRSGCVCVLFLVYICCLFFINTKHIISHDMSDRNIYYRWISFQVTFLLLVLCLLSWRKNVASIRYYGATVSPTLK
jgi:hypothetical protein